MRTSQELETQAKALEDRRREWLAARGRAGAGLLLSPAGNAGAVTLFNFPECFVTFNASGASAAPEAHRMVRRIDVVTGDQAADYQLIEEEFVTDDSGGFVRHYEPVAMVITDSPLEALIAGYQRMDEDRLQEQLEPIAEKIEAGHLPVPVTAEAIADLEGVAAGLSFSPAARLRIRSDAIAFLEGRLEGGDFVLRTVGRQECFAPKVTVDASQRTSEQMEIP